MRRFITTLTGKVVGQVAVAALLLPTLTLCLASQASAQIARRPVWAVIPFSAAGGKATPYGAAAARSVYDEISKRAESFRPAIEVTPPDQVARTEETLGLSDPITDQTSILRLGQELGATRIVMGQIVDSKIETVGGNKQANVLMQVEIRDVASGIDINGASVQAFSTVRAGSTSNDALINEALSIAASKAIGSIEAQALPTGTVLNTQPTIALVNQGSRSGFRVGQQVIITRGRDQVATGHVFDTDFDSSQVKIDRFIKGVAPGDKVSVVFTPQKFISIAPNGTARIEPTRNHGNNSGIISAVLVLGLAAILLGGKGNSGTAAAQEVNVEPTINTGTPANKVTWSSYGFFRYNGTAVVWQIYRGADNVPAGVVLGQNAHVFYDSTQTRDFTWYNFPPGSAVDASCTYTDLQGSTPVTGGPGVTIGRQYYYRVELVFRANILDLPGGGSTGSSSGNNGGSTGLTGGSTGTTSGNTGGSTGLTGGTTGTTSGTTGTTSGSNGGSTSGTGGTYCYFTSSQTTSRGGGTPIDPPQLNNPAEGATLSGSTPFTFNSVVSLDPFVAEYILQISTKSNFTSSTTKTFGPILSPATGTLSITADTTTIFTSFTGSLWWRVGARNSTDVPGPVPDPFTKKRYIFSAIRSFKRPTAPPPPPSSRGGL